MIEFKQIIGRGTRLFEGKSYFTIVDFVNASQRFYDDDWDGEPMEPEPVIKNPPIVKPPSPPGPEGPAGPEPEVERKLKIKLADGKVREIQTMRTTMFFVDGKAISAEDFLKRLFNTLNLPEFFGSEAELRRLWANPITRTELLQKLMEHGCGKEDLLKLQEMIAAENSDLFDVLEFVKYALKPITRATRAKVARSVIESNLEAKQLEFVDFLVSQYVESGVGELEEAKLETLLEIKYKIWR
jgi:type I restriction enzyme R subunit